MKHIRMGTRGSALALWQANFIKNELEKIHPQCRVEIINIKTLGDDVSEVPLERIGGDGIFVKQIEVALLNGEIHLAVHSMKDVPTVLPDGLIVGAIPERANSADVLISKQNCDFSNLPQGSKVGTSSLRRRSQLLHARNDLNIIDMRGNVNTRLDKLESDDFDAIILAYAGIERLGYSHKITQLLPYDICLPAVGQGALCVEIKADNEEVYDIVKSINHSESSAEVKSERAFLKKLGGGCRVPIAASAKVKDGELSLMGFVGDRDGKVVIRSDISGSQKDAEYLGEVLAANLIDMGADSILNDFSIK